LHVNPVDATRRALSGGQGQVEGADRAGEDVGQAVTDALEQVAAS
jgi:hypothetical protein